MTTSESWSIAHFTTDLSKVADVMLKGIAVQQGIQMMICLRKRTDIPGIFQGISYEKQDLIGEAQKTHGGIPQANYLLIGQSSLSCSAVTESKQFM